YAGLRPVLAGHGPRDVAVEPRRLLPGGGVRRAGRGRRGGVRPGALAAGGERRGREQRRKRGGDFQTVCVRVTHCFLPSLRRARRAAFHSLTGFQTSMISTARAMLSSGSRPDDGRHSWLTYPS